MCSSSTQLRWLSSLVLSCESCWEDGRVESVETPCLSCSKGPPSSTARLISFSCNDLHCEVKPIRKRNTIRSLELIHAWYWRTLLGWKANTWYEDGICTKNRTTWHIYNYLCKLSRSNLIKLQAIQHYKKYTSVMIHVCHSRSRFLSCMYIHDKFMKEPR